MRDLARFSENVDIQPGAVNLQTPALDQLSRMGSAIEQFGAQRVTAATTQIKNAIQRQAGIDLQSKSNQLMTEATMRFTDPVQQQEFYNKNMQAFSQSYVGGLPKSTRDYATKIVQASALSSQAKFNDRIVAQNKTNETVAYYTKQQQAQNNLQKEIQDSATLPDGTPNASFKLAQQSYQQIVNNSKLAAQRGLISPKDFQATSQAAQENFQGDLFLHQVTQRGQNNVADAEKFINDTVKKGLPGIDELHLQTLANKGRSILKGFSTALAGDSLIIDKNFQSAVQQMWETGKANPQYLLTYQNAHPEKAEGAANLMQMAEAGNAEVNNVVASPLYKQADELSAIRNRVSPYEFDQIAKQVNSANKAIGDDKYAYFASHPLVMQAALRQSEVQEGINETNSNLNVEGLIKADPAQANLVTQRLYGFPQDQLSVMGKQQAKAYVQQLQGLDINGKVQSLKAFMRTFKDPETQIIAMRDLKKAGLSQSVQMVFSALNNDQSSADTNDLMNWMASDQEQVNKRAFNLANDPAFTTNMRSAIDSNLEDFDESLENYGGDTSLMGQMVHHQVANYAQYLLANGKEPNISSAVEHAANTLVNNHFNYTSVNGHLIQLSKDVDESDLKTAFAIKLNEAKAADLQVPASFKAQYPAMNTEELKQQYILQAVNSGYLLSNASQSQGTLVDRSGAELKRADGRPFTIDYKDLKNPMSNLSKEVSEYPYSMHNIVNAAASRLGVAPLGALANLPHVLEGANQLLGKLNDIQLKQQADIEKSAVTGRLSPTEQAQLIDLENEAKRGA